MVEKYYIDTSIWRDLHEDRKDRFRPLGEWAFELFRKIRENKDKVLYSDLVVDELSAAFDNETISKIFSIMSTEGLLEKVDIKEHQVKEATKLKKSLNVPFGDALHAILARDNSATLVARDHHFEVLSEIVTVKKPEDLI